MNGGIMSDAQRKGQTVRVLRARRLDCLAQRRTEEMLAGIRLDRDEIMHVRRFE